MELSTTTDSISYFFILRSFVCTMFFGMHAPITPSKQEIAFINGRLKVPASACNTVVVELFAREELEDYAISIGIDLTHRTGSPITVFIFDKDFTYESEHIIELDTLEKRLSKVVRAPYESFPNVRAKLNVFMGPPKISCIRSTCTQVDLFVSGKCNTLVVISRVEQRESDAKMVGISEYVENKLGGGFSLRTMWDLIFPTVPFVNCYEIHIAAMTYPFNHLLPFNHHMTHTLEAHYKQPTQLQVHKTCQTDDVYVRAITLSIIDQREDYKGEELKVQFAILCVFLHLLPAKASKEVLEEKLPMGRILKNNQIETKVELQSVLRIEESAELSKHVVLPSYGRLARIHCNGKPAIHVFEMLHGNCY